MGYTTDFVGHIDITPPLNDDEINYLSAFARSRRCDRPGGPYDVPGNPAAERNSLSIERSNATAPGQPGLWCQWVPCWDGCCLAFDGHEKFYAAIPWLRYLIEHFLKPNAAASRRVDPMFANFSFDHRLDGMVVGCRRTTRSCTPFARPATRLWKRSCGPPINGTSIAHPCPTSSRSTARTLTETDVAGSPAGPDLV